MVKHRTIVPFIDPSFKWYAVHMQRTQVGTRPREKRVRFQIPTR